MPMIRASLNPMASSFRPCAETSGCTSLLPSALSTSTPFPTELQPRRAAYTKAPSLPSRMCYLSLIDHEGRGPGNLVVEGPGRGVVGLGVPVDAVRAPAVRFRVEGFYQGARGARAAVRPGDEQVLQVAVAPRRPRRRVEDRVREPDEAAVVLGDQAEEAVRALVKPAERIFGDLCRHLVTVEGVVSVPER